MSLVIEQRPLYRTMPVGQDIIFAVSENNIVANKFRVKFVAEMFVANSLSGTFQPQSKTSTLKVTPNNKGVGIFSLQPFLESYVSPQYLMVYFLVHLKEVLLHKIMNTQYI